MPIIQYIDQLPSNTESQWYPYAMRPLTAVNKVVIHHSVGLPTTPPESINIGHMNRNGGGVNGWPRIGYHFYVMGDGRAYQVNYLTSSSFHVGDDNWTSIGICLAGDFTTNHPTPAQMEATKEVFRYLKTYITFQLTMHRNLMATQCPGNSWAGWMPELHAALEESAAVRTWEKVTILVHESATEDQYAAAARIAWPTKTEVTMSADNAFARPSNVTSHRVIVLGGDRYRGGQQGLLEWVQSEYPYNPPTDIEFNSMPGSDDFAFHAWPTDYRHYTQAFGANPANYAQFGLPGHEGVDIRAYAGTSVYAVAEGTVITRGWDPDGYGNYIVLDHGDWLTYYAHLSSFSVAFGAQVVAGQEIGKSGNTGNSFGAHLHLSLKHKTDYYTDQNGTQWPRHYFDPTPYLANV